MIFYELMKLINKDVKLIGSNGEVYFYSPGISQVDYLYCKLFDSPIKKDFEVIVDSHELFKAIKKVGKGVEFLLDDYSITLKSKKKTISLPLLSEEISIRKLDLSFEDVSINCTVSDLLDSFSDIRDYEGIVKLESRPNGVLVSLSNDFKNVKYNSFITSKEGVLSDVVSLVDPAFICNVLAIIKKEFKNVVFRYSADSPIQVVFENEEVKGIYTVAPRAE